MPPIFSPLDDPDFTQSFRISTVSFSIAGQLHALQALESWDLVKAYNQILSSVVAIEAPISAGWVLRLAAGYPPPAAGGMGLGSSNTRISSGVPEKWGSGSPPSGARK